MNMTRTDQLQLIDEQGLESKDEYTHPGLPFRLYQSIGTTESIQEEASILKWNGILKERNKRNIKRMYRFYLCQFTPLAVYQTGNPLHLNQPILTNQSLQRQKWNEIKYRTKELEKAKQLAIRSLYVLGYDLGIVDISISRTAPKYKVVKISPLKPTSAQMEIELNDLASLTYQRAQKHQHSNAMIGADIEFVLRHNNGKYVIASDYFKRHGKVGHDAIWLRGNRNKYPLGELRPSPSTNPRKIFEHLYRCLKAAVNKINNPFIEWLAGGYPLPNYPIGGHIHFSQISLDPYFIRALDNYLTLPLFLLESETSLKRRPKYGFIGDYREQFHGGFEYRTPPSWIVSPTVAKGVLCLAKVIANDYLELKWMPFNRFEVQQAFYEGDQRSIYPIVQVLWSELKRCPSYEEYQEELQAFYDLIQKGYTWNEYDDIRYSWGLPPYKR